MKRFLKSFCSFGLVLLLMLSLSITSFADINDLMIGTGSNALMTMELDDSDYAVMPLSSLGTVVNTIGTIGVRYRFQYYDSASSSLKYTSWFVASFSSDAFRVVKPDLASTEYLTSFEISIPTNCLPRPGIYEMSYDFISDVGITYSDFYVWSQKNYENASNVVSRMFLPYAQSSGDLYVEPIKVNLTNIDSFMIITGVNNAPDYRTNQLSGYFKVRFAPSSGAADYGTAGSNTTTQDYENDVSSSLSDLSSSVDTMTDEISGVTEAIQNLQGAMEPHYSNVLAQLHHITEQLHAFYDQVYNNIHLPELDMLTQIRNAIENIDLQIEVDISEVKTAINNMSTAVQNKLQTTTDQITNGYDNSGIIQENEKLEQSINDYDQVESEIFDEAGGFVGEFEYPSIDSLSGSVIKALAFVGSFLQSIFLSMGDFGSIITFSLTMIFVMVVVGYHRIRS